MKTLTRIIIAGLLFAGLLTACNVRTSTDEQQNAIDTAVAGTQMAEALAQATLNANALTAMPATPTPGPTIEYVTLTEEELAALIDQAVAEAISACEQTTQAVTTTTGSDTITSDDIEYVYSYYYYADYYLGYAEELLDAYYDLYGDLAYEMIAELNAIETELVQLNDTMSQISVSLDEISNTLSQGAAIAQESIAQLESAARQAQETVSALQTQAQNILPTLQADQQNRLDAIAQVQADEVPANRMDALRAGFQFVDYANSALADGKMSRDELLGMARLGANAQAGFQNFGGRASNDPDLGQLSGRFSEINSQFARGQFPQGRTTLQQFELSLGQRPSGLRR